MAKKKTSEKTESPELEATQPDTPESLSRAKLNSIIAGITKEYGLPSRSGKNDASPVIRASDCPRVLRIPTGIFAVDFVTGGGIPIKRILEIAGSEGTSKTTLVLILVGYAHQRLCNQCYHYACDCVNRGKMRVTWIDVEGAYTKEWADVHGVDNDFVLLVRSGYAEADLDISAKLIDSGEVDIIVYDSIAMTCPEEERSKSMEDMQRGLLARHMNKALRKWQSALNFGGPVENSGCSVVMINQYRESMKMNAGRILPGGEGQKFAASIILDLSKGKKGTIDVKETESVGGQIKWQEYKVRAKKNKLLAGGGLGVYRMWLRDYKTNRKGELEENRIILDCAAKYGVIKNDGTDWVWDEFKAQSRPGFQRLLEQTKLPGTEDLQGLVTFWDKLRFDVIETMLGEEIHPRLYHRNQKGK